MPYLNRVEINTIAGEAQKAGLGTNATRHALLDALNPNYAATLVDVGGGPLIQLLKDLNAMNLVDQFADGSVPLLDCSGRRASSPARRSGAERMSSQSTRPRWTRRHRASLSCPTRPL